jgi:transposase
MTIQERIVKNKMGLMELAEYLQNVSEACKINGVSRQHFYDIKKAYEENGIEGLKDKTRRKPCIKNRVAPEIEEAVMRMSYEKPAYGQLRASNELRKQGVLISGGGVRSIWQRHNVETFAKRLKVLEERSA